MANIRLVAIRPKSFHTAPPAGQKARLDRELADFIGKVHADMADYPEQIATKSGYIRSGEYGRAWDEQLSGSPREVRLVNNVRATDARFQTKRKGVVRRRYKRARHYGSFVGGKKSGAANERQAREMGRRGWKRIDDVTRRHWPAAKRRLIRILTDFP